MTAIILPGDVIRIFCGVFHYGVVTGEDSIVHFTARHGKGLKRMIVESSIEEFRGTGVMEKIEFDHCLEAEDVIRRARSLIGSGLGTYRLFGNNCEHASFWCKTGEARSIQTENAVRVAVKAAAIVGPKILAKAAARSTVRASTKAATRLVSPWLLLSDAAQAGVELLGPGAGLTQEQAESAGRKAGFYSSAAIGGIIGGPAGAITATAIWGFGEIVSRLCSSNRRLNKHESQNRSTDLKEG